MDTEYPVVRETKDGKINLGEAAAAVGALPLVLGLPAAWLSASKMLGIKRESDPVGREAYPGQGKDRQEDAFRHSYWNARMTQEFDARRAKELASMHEAHADPTPLDEKRETMDLYNNEVGRRIGEQYPDATPEELKQHIRRAIERGEMLVINDKGELVPSDDGL